MCEQFDLGITVVFEAGTLEPVGFTANADWLPEGGACGVSSIYSCAPEIHFDEWVSPEFSFDPVNEPSSFGYSNYPLAFTVFLLTEASAVPAYASIYSTRTAGPRFGTTHSVGTELHHFPAELAEMSAVGTYDGTPTSIRVLDDPFAGCASSTELSLHEPRFSRGELLRNGPREQQLQLMSGTRANAHETARAHRIWTTRATRG